MYDLSDPDPLLSPPTRVLAVASHVRKQNLFISFFFPYFLPSVFISYVFCHDFLFWQKNPSLPNPKSRGKMEKKKEETTIVI